MRRTKIKKPFLKIWFGSKNILERKKAFIKHIITLYEHRLLILFSINNKLKQALFQSLFKK